MESLIPVLKWVGGKRQLINKFVPYFPDTPFEMYCEPFLGGGAVLFFLHPDKAVVNDVNPELINFYAVLKSDCEALIEELSTYEYNKEFFYTLRNLDRDAKSFAKLSNLKKAARTYYLNRTCFNGLYRVNSIGLFNSPFGSYKTFNLYPDRLRMLSSYLNSANVQFTNGDFEKLIDYLPDNSFVYLDPPYDPISQTAFFTSYSQTGFSKEDQIRLKNFCDRLNERGIRFMLSNSATSFIKELYKDYDQKFFNANRSINSKATNRGGVKEILVRNYK